MPCTARRIAYLAFAKETVTRIELAQQQLLESVIWDWLESFCM